MNIVQVGIIGVLGTLIAVQFKGQKAEYGIYIGMAVSLFVFFNIVSRLGTIVELVKDFTSLIQLKASYIETLLKMLGITYVAEFSSNLCKDAGYQTIASQIEIFGKLTILVLSLPILQALMQTIQTLLGR